VLSLTIRVAFFKLPKCLVSSLTEQNRTNLKIIDPKLDCAQVDAVVCRESGDERPAVSIGERRERSSNGVVRKRLAKGDPIQPGSTTNSS